MLKSIRNIIVLTFITSIILSAQSKLLIYMDFDQTNHLKAYGITFRALMEGNKADWLLNYRGGSFLLDYSDNIAAECRLEGVIRTIPGCGTVKID